MNVSDAEADEQPLLQEAAYDKRNAGGPVAQLVEHLLCKQDVIGSNPFRSTSLPVTIKLLLNILSKRVTRFTTDDPLINNRLSTPKARECIFNLIGNIAEVI